jgi:flagellar biogenesis protein FliO
MPSSRLVFSLALLVAVCACSANLRAEQAPHVLFSFDRKQADAEADESTKTLAPPAPLPKQLIPTDKVVIPATHEQVVAEEPHRDPRRLAPLTRQELVMGTPRGPTQSKGKLPFEVPGLDSLGTAGAGLVLVLGLFLVCVALMRRSGPSPTSPLPRDAVAVLGRIPLMPKQFAHLLQVGNKLVLVSISGDRTDTITEITEPAEVDRLLAVCMKGNGQSSSAEFQRVLGQMAKEPARGFLARNAASSYARTARG